MSNRSSNMKSGDPFDEVLREMVHPEVEECKENVIRSINYVMNLDPEWVFRYCSERIREINNLKTESIKRSPGFIGLSRASNSTIGNILYGIPLSKMETNEDVLAFRRNFHYIVDAFYSMTIAPSEAELESAYSTMRNEMIKWRDTFKTQTVRTTQPPLINWSKRGWGEPEYLFVEFMRRRDFSNLTISCLHWNLVDTLYNRICTSGLHTVRGPIERVMGLIKEEAELFKRRKPF